MNAFDGHVDVTAAALYHHPSSENDMVYLILVTREAGSMTTSSPGALTLQEIRGERKSLETLAGYVVCGIFGNISLMLYKSL